MTEVDFLSKLNGYGVTRGIIIISKTRICDIYQRAISCFKQKVLNEVFFYCTKSKFGRSNGDFPGLNFRHAVVKVNVFQDSIYNIKK